MHVPEGGGLTNSRMCAGPQSARSAGIRTPQRDPSAADPTLLPCRALLCLSSLLQLVHGVAKYFQSTLAKPGAHEYDVATSHASLDYGADLVQVGVAREDQEG